MKKINLRDIDTRAPKELDKREVKEKTAAIIAELDELQNLLYAEGRHSILVILQGMDASGKDGLIRNVLGHMNPQGVTVTSFKTPTQYELAHDFLWRIHAHSPIRGMIGVFNRSHYEDILITRVHGWADDETARKRMEAINSFEKLLTEHNNTHIIKCYLHISRAEQTERLQERLTDPRKMWKYNAGDYKEAEHWEKYMEMYQDCFNHCNEPEWLIVPSDQNWYKEYVVASALRDLLVSLKMSYPVKTEGKA